MFSVEREDCTDDYYGKEAEALVNSVGNGELVINCDGDQQT